MSDSEKNLPAWRQGWPWTLIKCAAALVTTSGFSTGAIYLLVRWMMSKLPDWVPTAWVQMLFDWILKHVWFVGPLFGLLIGGYLALGIVVYDAKKGKLTRIP